MINTHALVLHFRTVERTKACLESLMLAGVDKIVVVDNSEDLGRSLLEVKGALPDELLSTIDVVDEGQNLGFSKGVCAGLRKLARMAPGNVLLINSDATIDRLSLLRLAEELDRVHIAIPTTVMEQGETRLRSLVYYQKALGLYLRFQCPGSVAYPSGCCLMLRRDILGLPLFDADFFFYGEDVLLGQRIAQFRLLVGERRDATVVHAGSASAKNGSLFYEYHMVRAHWLLGRKLSSGTLQRVAYLVARSFLLPSRAVLRCVRWRTLLPLKGFLMATLDTMRSRLRPLTPSALS